MGSMTQVSVLGRNRRRSVVVAATAAMATGAAAITFAASPAAAQAPAACGVPTISGTTATLVCAYTGAEQSFTYPSGVTSATFTVAGAQGASSTTDPIEGGRGGETVATLSQPAGTTLTVIVGGEGTAGTGQRAFGGGGGASASVSGGGGGGSFIQDATGANLIVAGGGGGFGSCLGTSGPADGGGGGGEDGAPGTPCTGQGNIAPGGAGGAGGGSGFGIGQGADGEGAGGGGAVGGGAGSCFGGFCSGGGGGSGFAPAGATSTTGVHAGDGLVTITWQVPAQAEAGLVAAPVTVLGSILTLTVTYSATLSDADTGAPLAGRTVSFTQSGASCSATTNATGLASCSVPILNIVAVLLGQPYAASFAGDATHLPATTSGPSRLL